MFVTLKTLQQDSFVVEFDTTQPVKSLKEKIEKVKGDEYPARNMKLMYAGKILADNKRVCDYNIEEKKFVIILIKKLKSALVRDVEEALDDSDVSLNSSPNNGSRERLFLSARRGSDPNLVSDVVHEQMVRQLTDMGYGRDDVERALRASFNYPDRAVEYLITGVFPGSNSSNDSESDDNRANIPNNQDTPASDSENSSAVNRERPNISSPSNELLQGSSRLATLVTPSPSQESIYQLLNERLDENQQAAAVVANLRTPEDHEAIERLRQLGFPEYQATEAYFACERNENSAADFLFSQNYD